MHAAPPPAPAITPHINTQDGEILRVFLHISDLHIGKPEDDNMLSGYLPDVPLMHGIHGHDRNAVTELIDFYHYIETPNNAPPTLIVTGDLTRCGKREEYELFFGLLSEMITRSDNYAVPGNHDHWPGKPYPFGRPAVDYRMFLRACPSIDTVVSICDDVRLRFIRFNSYVDVNAEGSDALFARGAFQTELAKADQELRALPLEQNVKEIRILLLHHSIFYDDGPVRIGEITIGCREPLWQFIANHNVRILLTGHTHCPIVIDTSVRTSDGQLHQIAECRSGTTCQKVQGVAGLEGTGSGSNTIIVHQLLKRRQSYVWRSMVYWRSLLKGFAPNKPDYEEIKL